MSDSLLKAQAVARVILAAHRQFTVDHLLQVPTAFSYLRQLRALDALDLSRPKSLREIAKAQILEELEWSYNQRVSDELWASLVGSRFPDLAMPQNLGSAGLMVRHLLDEHDAAFVYALPQGWEETAAPLESGPKQLHRKPDQSPDEVMRAYFAPLAEIKGNELGGHDLMVAMNQDAGYGRAAGEDSVTVLDPSAFHFALATGEDNAVTLVLEDKIAIEEVVLGCDPNYADGYQGAGSAPSGIAVGITITNKSQQTQRVQIPAGSVFEVGRAGSGVQNVAVAHDYELNIPGGGQDKVVMSGRCLNQHRGSPHGHEGRMTPFRYAGPDFEQGTIWNRVSNPRTDQ